MSSSAEFEFLLKRATTLLHSSQSNSAFELRQLLDEEIKKRYGSEKMITNSMNKKQLDEEANFPGRRAATPPPQPVEEIINLINSPAKTISDSPDTIVDSEDASGALLSTTAEDEANLKEFGDLNCCVCGEMMFTATNRLIECCKCGSLYHQECHKPLIADDEISDDQVQNWQCDNCVNKPSTTKAAGLIADELMPLTTTSIGSINKSKSSATSSRSSSSSNSSSPFYKAEHTLVSSGTTSKVKEEKPASSTSKCATTINTGITQSSSSSSSKKHSSSSPSSNKSKSSSRHHDSKRKSAK